VWGFLTKPRGWGTGLALIVILGGARIAAKRWAEHSVERQLQAERDRAAELQKQAEIDSQARKEASRAADEEFSRRLVGTWTGTFELEGVSTSGTTTYFANGTYTSEGKLRKRDGTEIHLRENGNWRIENKKISEKTTQSNNPELLPVGDISTSDIITLTEAELVVRTEKGHTATSRRVVR
jgi:hypothetical protein